MSPAGNVDSDQPHTNYTNVSSNFHIPRKGRKVVWYPVKKVRRNLLTENKKCPQSISSNQSKSVFSWTNSTKVHGGFVGSDSCNSDGNFVFGDRKSSTELNFGNARVPFEVENSGSKWNSDSNFVFRADNGGSLSSSSTGNTGFVFSAYNSNSSMQSSSTNTPNDSRDCLSSCLNNGDAGFFSSANHCSSPNDVCNAGKTSLSNGNVAFVFSANIHSSSVQSSSTNRSLNDVPDAHAFPRGSKFMSSSVGPSGAARTGERDRNEAFVFNAKSSFSTLSSGSTDLNDAPDVHATVSESFKSSSRDPSCLFSASKNDSSSKVDPTGYIGALGHSKRVDNFAFTFTAKNGEVPSGLKFGMEGLNDSSSACSDGRGSRNKVFNFGDKKAYNMNSGRKDDFRGVWETKPDVIWETNVGTGVNSQKDAGCCSLFGSDCTHAKSDHFSSVTGDSGKALMSDTESERTRSNNIGGTTEFVSKGETSNHFGFRGSAKKNSSSPAGWKNQLNGETTGTNNMKLPNEAIQSDFKFVIGSGCTAGSAFYKVPLCKLVDEMKCLRIDDYSGTGGHHKVNNVGISSHFHTSGVNTTQNGGPGPCLSTKRVGDTSRNQHRNPHVDSTVGACQAEKVNITSNMSHSRLDDISMAGSYLGGEAKAIKPGAMINTASTFKAGVTSGVYLSCPPSTGLTREDNQPLNSGISTSGPVQQRSWGCEEFPTTEVENKENLSFTSAPSDLRSSPDLNKPSSSKSNPLAELSENLEFVLNGYTGETSKEKQLKKTGRKLRLRSRPKNMTQPKNIPTDNNSSKYFMSPGHCSPMDFSPCLEKTDVASDFASASVSAVKKDEYLSEGSERSATTSDGQSFGKNSFPAEDLCRNNFMPDPSLCVDGSSKVRRHYPRKYKLKVRDASKGKPTIQNVDLPSSVQFSSLAPNTSHNVKSQSQVQSGFTRNTDSKADGEGSYQDPIDGWRIRGNEAYKTGDLSKAEELYTKGIHSAVDKNDPTGTIQLCYGNRAATRMALGRMREALEDCKSAAALDPNFTKVQLRAAHCHLVLGEFESAMKCYGSCLESANRVCLDRRLAIEAADSLRKAQKVAGHMCQSVELLKQRTSEAANTSLSLVTEALSISFYSEKLLEMKGEALFLLRKYKEVIDLCEQTLQTAEKNFTADNLVPLESNEWKSSPRLWRWHLMARSYFHWGRLEVAIDLLEKGEQLLSCVDSYRSMNEESPASLAVTIRDLLHRKKAGNEAFKRGNHMEAFEHYTAAISIGVESRPFAAVCFCNRAAAHQALGQIVDAIADCNLAIALDGNYFKAISRRATLYEMIKDYKYAHIDLEKLVALLESKSQEKSRQPGRQGESSGDKDLKQARRRLSLIGDKMRKDIPLDLYLIMGITASDTESDIKKAYRKAALKHHPDKAAQFFARNENGDDGRLWKDIGKMVHDDADKLFKMIGEAYGILSDPDKRSKYNYDEEIRNCPRESNRNTNYGRSPNFHSYRRQSDFHSYEEFERRHW